MITIYNSLNPSNYIMVVVAIVVGIVIGGIGGFLLYLLISSKAHFFKNILLYIIGTVMFVAGIYVLGTMLTSSYYNVRYVLVPYSQGAYQEVEGEVENYRATELDKDVYFDLDGENFHIGNYEIGDIGYQGHSIKNGDYLRIRYFEYDENIILRIEKEDTVDGE